MLDDVTLTASPTNRQERPAEDQAPRARLIARLRGDATTRPRVDPGLAGGLREWLEDGVAQPARSLGPAFQPLGVDKEALSAVLGPRRSDYRPHRIGAWRLDRPVTAALARGIVVDILFRQLVTTGKITDPMTDAVAALEVDEGRTDVLAFLSALDASGRADLVIDVTAHVQRLADDWGPLPAAWLPRTQERSAVPLAAGAVVLVGTVDLALGAPCAGRASVVLIEVKSGGRRAEHRADLHYYALLETLRSGAPPLRVATYYTATGELDVDEVSDDLLTSAVLRTLDGVARLCDLAAESEAQ